MDLFYLWQMRRLWLMLGLSLAPLVAGWAQETGQAEALQAPALAFELDTLRALADSHGQLLRAIREKQAAIKAAAGGAETDALKRELMDLETRSETLEQDFAAVATGVTAQDYTGSAEPEGDLNLQQELSRILAPILAEVRNLSKKPRAIQELQTTLATQKHRVDLAQVAVTSLEVQLAAATESKEPAQSALMVLLKQLHTSWQARLAEAKSRVLAIDRQLNELQAEQVGLVGVMTEATKQFFFARGRVILLAIAMFLGVFFGLRFLYFHALRVVPVTKMERLSFFFRALALLNQGLSLGLGLLAALIVLYASGDWLLSAVAMLILIVIALAAKSGFMRYFEQVKMLLNVGSAREGERVLIAGVPWRIGTINLQTRLSNPCIDGPGLRLPLEALMGMTSRPVAKHESWFPCRSGEMVLLPNDLLAKVEQVHSDFVELRYRAGITRQIPTSEFIKLQPENLSGGFLVSTTFGLDYSLQAEITQHIPQQMEADLQAGLLKLVPEGQLVEVKVEFKEAAASSLNLLLVAKFKGSSANLFLDLRRALQRLAVESANAHGWPIPFPQLTVHQAAAANHLPSST
jgi:small-conductance mechanosensitive channel